MCKGNFHYNQTAVGPTYREYITCITAINCSQFGLSTDSDLAGSGTGLFPAFGAPTSPGTGLFGQTGASSSSAFGGRALNSSGQLTVQYNVRQDVHDMQTTTCRRLADWCLCNRNMPSCCMAAIAMFFLVRDVHQVARAIRLVGWLKRVELVFFFFLLFFFFMCTAFRCICFFPCIPIAFPRPRPTPAQQPALLSRVWPALTNPSRRPFWSATCCLLGFQHSFWIWIIWVWSTLFCCIPRCCFSLILKLQKRCHDRYVTKFCAVHAAT